MANELTIDATEAPLGRLATFAAKSALLGKEIRIINCNSVVITGKKAAIVEVYKVKIRRGGYSQKGPYIPRTADRLVRRTVRGMLPWNITRGREAYKRVKCYTETPKEFENQTKIIHLQKAKKPYLAMGELIELI